MVAGAVLVVSGLVVGLVIRYLPGRGGHSPADGFKVGGGPPRPIDVPGVALASIATLALGAVLGPEAPLIAIGGGLGALTVHLVKSDAPPMATVVIAARQLRRHQHPARQPAGRSLPPHGGRRTGRPPLGHGPRARTARLGMGNMVFAGRKTVDRLWHLLAQYSQPGPPPGPTIAELGWAVVIGVGATVLGGVIRWTALFVRPFVERNLVLFTPLAGAAVAGIAIAFAEGTGKSYAAVLFSGQNELAPFAGRRRQLVGGRPRGGGRLQRGGLRHLAEQLPGRPYLSLVVHRCRRGHRPLAPGGLPMVAGMAMESVPCPPSCSSFP